MTCFINSNITDSLKQTEIDSFLHDVQKPFLPNSDQYHLLNDIGSTTSPAVSSVLNLQKCAGLLGSHYNTHYDNNRSNIDGDRMKMNRETLRMEKDSSSLAAAAISTNPNIAHDVESRHRLKKAFKQPSQFIHGMHVDEIREQQRMLKKYETMKKSNPSCASIVTPSPLRKHTTSRPIGISNKAIARSYRNNLDTAFAKDNWMKPNVVNEGDGHNLDRETDTKPEFDWILEVRVECLKQMKKTSDKEKSKKLVKLMQCIGRKQPTDLFNDVLGVWEVSKISDYSITETVDLMLAFVD